MSDFRSVARRTNPGPIKLTKENLMFEEEFVQIDFMQISLTIYLARVGVYENSNESV